jgi:hypothetical protein
MNKLTEPFFAFGVVVLFVVYALIANAVQGATFTDLLFALEKVESNGNESAYNEREDALGCLQIRPIMVADYNRIYGTSLHHSEMDNRSNSHLVAIGIFDYYGKYIERSGEEITSKHLAFIWNGGGSAWKRVKNTKNDQKQKNLEIYWTKVCKYL